MKFYVYIDFEFNQTQEEFLNLVCCSLQVGTSPVEEFWLHNSEKGVEDLSERLRQLDNEGAIFVAYAVVAEARSFYSLGIDPYKINWIDLYLEYRHLSNHKDEIMYGKHYVDGKVKDTKRLPPKWQRTEEDRKFGFKQKFNLVECAYKFCNVKIDSKHKDVMRDLIISDPDSFNENQKKAIMAYCSEDVKYLPEIHSAMLETYEELKMFDKEKLLKDLLLRGKYAALTAIRESRGYPIAYEKAKNFSSHVESILADTQREINKLFPEISPFNWNHKQQRFNFRQKFVQDWVAENENKDKWLKTDKGALSLSLDAWQQVYSYNHTYPKDIFGAQMVRYLKLKQSLNGFLPSKSKKSKSLWDSVGSDGWVRPYMGIYGSQSSRSQPSATSFLMLKPAWMRALVYPPEGYVITGLDYGSEEFLISACLSEDEDMIEAYESGDPYLAFAKLVGAVPRNATKKSHARERVPYKSTVLGLSYDMTKIGLAAKLTRDTGEEWTEEMAQDQIDQFAEAFSEFIDFKENCYETYQSEGYLELRDGWRLWGDNDNERSVKNFVIQGAGAAIMRAADMYCHEAGLYVPITLHDALYILHREDDLGAIDKAIDCMHRGFVEYFPEKIRHRAASINIDAEVWGPGLKGKETVTTPAGRIVNCEDIHIDERAIDDYKKFSRYFEDLDPDNLF